MNAEPLYKFIAIEGNIGAGKTTFATQFASDTNSKLILEQFADNPFLPKFYEDPEKHAFPLELSFLAERYHQLKNELSTTDLFRPNIVSDYYFLKCLIFAKANLKGDEFDLYTKLFHIINDALPKPDLFVFLFHSIERLQENIKKRGRPYEQKISNEYLQKVQNTYFDFIKQLQNQRIVIIDVNDIDFVNNKNDYIKLISSLQQPYQLGITRISL